MPRAKAAMAALCQGVAKKVFSRVVSVSMESSSGKFSRIDEGRGVVVDVVVVVAGDDDDVNDDNDGKDRDDKKSSIVVVDGVGKSTWGNSKEKEGSENVSLPVVGCP